MVNQQGQTQALDTSQAVVQIVAAASSLMAFTLVVGMARAFARAVFPDVGKGVQAIGLYPHAYSQKSYVVADHRFHGSDYRKWKPAAPYEPKPAEIIEALEQLPTTPLLSETLPHLAPIPELVRRLEAVSEELASLSLMELVGLGQTQRLASITRREIEKDEGIGGAFQETDGLRKGPFSTVESWLEPGGYAHRYPVLQGVAQAVIEAAEAKVEKARAAVSPEVLSDINYRISQRTSYGLREEVADAPGTIIVWSNASADWYTTTPVRKGERLTLDANQVFVPYPKHRVQAVLHKLDRLPLFKYSYEAITRKKEQAKRLGAEGRMESDERWLEGLRRLGLKVYAEPGYTGAIPAPLITEMPGLQHIGGGHFSDGKRVFRLRLNPETGTRFYVAEDAT